MGRKLGRIIKRGRISWSVGWKQMDGTIIISSSRIIIILSLRKRRTNDCY
jgi:hypothetical protein